MEASGSICGDLDFEHLRVTKEGAYRHGCMVRHQKRRRVGRAGVWCDIHTLPKFYRSAPLNSSRVILTLGRRYAAPRRRYFAMCRRDRRCGCGAYKLPLLSSTRLLPLSAIRLPRAACPPHDWVPGEGSRGSSEKHLGRRGELRHIAQDAGAGRRCGGSL